MKLLIAVPCMDMMHTSFVRSLTEMYKPTGTVIAYVQGTLIYEARNVIAHNAVKEGFDRVLWLDSDMIVPRDTIQRLGNILDSGADLATGLYFGRKPPYNPVILEKLEWFVHDDGNVEVNSDSFTDYPRDCIFPVAGCGFGCCMTKTEMLSKVIELYGSPFTPMMGMGEDVAFCWRAGKAGFGMYCDSRTKCGHVGQYTITERDYISGTQRNKG